MPRIVLERDAKRLGCWVRGEGFACFAHWRLEGSATLLECNHVERENEPYRLQMSIRVGPAGMATSRDVLETAVARYLATYWDCTGPR